MLIPMMAHSRVSIISYTLFDEIMDDVKTEEISFRDFSSISFFLIFSVLFISIYFYVSSYDLVGLFDSSIMHGDGGLTTALLSIFRILCAYLAFHTAIFWMIKNPVPGKMNPLFREGSEITEYNSLGFERLVPFSSWTLLIFGLTMLWNGFSSFWVFLGHTPSEIILHIGTAIFAAAFSSAVLTASIIRYIILPNMVKRGIEIDHMFLPHEQVMHNFALILLSCEFVFGTMSIRLPMIALGVVYGACYLIFAELWARYGGGYYVYEFIDPRPPEGPFFLVGLTLVCAASFSFGLLISFLQDYNKIISNFLILVLIILCTKFSAPADYEPNST